MRLFGEPVVPALIKLFVLSVLVGLVLALFGIDPLNFWGDVWDGLRGIWDHGFEAIEWAFRYFLLGAIIVVPIYLIVKLSGAVFGSGSRDRQRRGPPQP